MPISALESAGINTALVKKLQEAGYYTVESVGAPFKPSFVGGFCHHEEASGSEGNQRSECPKSAGCRFKTHSYGFYHGGVLVVV